MADENKKVVVDGNFKEEDGQQNAAPANPAPAPAEKKNSTFRSGSRPSVR